MPARPCFPALDDRLAPSRNWNGLTPFHVDRTRRRRRSGCPCSRRRAPYRVRRQRRRSRDRGPRAWSGGSPLGATTFGSSLPDGVTSGVGVGSPVTFSMIGVGVAVTVAVAAAVGLVDVVAAVGLDSPTTGEHQRGEAARVVSRSVMVRSAGETRRRSQGSAVLLDRYGCVLDSVNVSGLAGTCRAAASRKRRSTAGSRA